MIRRASHGETFDTGLDEVLRNRLSLRNPSFGVRSSSPAMGVSEDEGARSAKPQNDEPASSCGRAASGHFVFCRGSFGATATHYETDEAIERTLKGP